MSAFVWLTFSLLNYSNTDYQLKNDILKAGLNACTLQVIEKAKNNELGNTDSVSYRLKRLSIDINEMKLNDFIEAQFNNNYIATYSFINDNIKFVRLAINPLKIDELKQERYQQRNIWLYQSVLLLFLVGVGIYGVFSSIEKIYEINKQQNNFLLSVTHEFKTPIAAIRLMLQTSKHPKINEDKRSELVDNSIFMVYDGMMIYGENIMTLNFTDRISRTEMFVKGIMKIKKDKIQIKMKQFFSTRKIKTFLEDYLPQITYKTDGLVFTPINDPIRIGTHETMFKWKPQNLNTIDFQVKRRSNTSWGFYIQDRGVLIFQSQIEGPESEWLKEDNILECQYMIDETPSWWKPVGIRTDKHHPNNRRTYYRTMVNVRENIQIDEFNKIFA